jgi:3-oxoacyl-[acyl-carrier-protein] synthase-3
LIEPTRRAPRPPRAVSGVRPQHAPASRAPAATCRRRILTNADLETSSSTPATSGSASPHRHPPAACRGSRARPPATSPSRPRSARWRPPASTAAEIDLIIVGTTTPDVIFPSTACLVQHRSARTAARRSTSMPPAPASSTRCRLPTSSSAPARAHRAGDRRRDADAHAGLERPWHLRAVRRRRRRSGAEGGLRRPASCPPTCMPMASTRNCCTTRSACRAGSSRRAERRRARDDERQRGVQGRREARSTPWSTRRWPPITCDKSAIDWLVPHQANLRIITATAKRLDMPMERVIVTVDKHGNTSSGSVPLALDEAVRSARSSAASCCCWKPSAAASPGARR